MGGNGIFSRYMERRILVKVLVQPPGEIRKGKFTKDYELKEFNELENDFSFILYSQGK